MHGRTDLEQPRRDGQACLAVGMQHLDVESCDGTVLRALLGWHRIEAVDRLHRRREELAAGGLRKLGSERRTKKTQEFAQVAGRYWATELLRPFLLLPLRLFRCALPHLAVYSPPRCMIRAGHRRRILRQTVLKALSVKLGRGVAVENVLAWKCCATLPALAVGMAAERLACLTLFKHHRAAVSHEAAAWVRSGFACQLFVLFLQPLLISFDTPCLPFPCLRALKKWHHTGRELVGGSRGEVILPSSSLE